MAILNVHYVLGMLLFLTAIAAIFLAPARRYVVYVLALQIVVGAVTWSVTKGAPPAAHWILAILVGGVWPMANALERRGRPRAAVMGISAVAVIVLAYVIYLGMRAVQA
ncbi:MAG: hypothetical protein IAI50_15560 [Candidatus Eremiobacteraeota bacterium]|nr:hypothetical protein [Candidatus Eremiobacteraeota bacterium]